MLQHGFPFPICGDWTVVGGWRWCPHQSIDGLAVVPEGVVPNAPADHGAPKHPVVIAVVVVSLDGMQGDQPAEGFEEPVAVAAAARGRNERDLGNHAGTVVVVVVAARRQLQVDGGFRVIRHGVQDDAGTPDGQIGSRLVPRFRDEENLGVGDEHLAGNGVIVVGRGHGLAIIVVLGMVVGWIAVQAGLILRHRSCARGDDHPDRDRCLHQQGRDVPGKRDRVGVALLEEGRPGLGVASPQGR
mmetsp:Transcript_21847/g.51982  ORF Transcript_21847/g.51982 Transcript_21847/m.51982 type:complete len:243 (+) Transcript_21847:512-1240(+)